MRESPCLIIPFILYCIALCLDEEVTGQQQQEEPLSRWQWTMLPQHEEGQQQQLTSSPPSSLTSRRYANAATYAGGSRASYIFQKQQQQKPTANTQARRANQPPAAAIYPPTPPRAAAADSLQVRPENSQPWNSFFKQQQHPSISSNSAQKQQQQQYNQNQDYAHGQKFQISAASGGGGYSSPHQRSTSSSSSFNTNDQKQQFAAVPKAIVKPAVSSHHHGKTTDSKKRLPQTGSSSSSKYTGTKKAPNNKGIEPIFSTTGNDEQRKQPPPPPSFLNIAQSHQSLPFGGQMAGNNVDRYMPLLGHKTRSRSSPPSSTESILDNNQQQQQQSSASPTSSSESEWSPPEGEEDEDNQQQVIQTVEEEEEMVGRPPPPPPCISAACRTWVMITIPETGAVIQWPTLPMLPKPEAPPSPLKPSEAASSSSSIFPPQPLPLPPAPPSRAIMANRTMKIARQKPPSLLPVITPPVTMAPSTSSSSSSAEVTTNVYPPSFIFSTKWVIPINPHPKNNFTRPSPPPLERPVVMTTEAPPMIITTSTRGSVDIGGGGGPGEGSSLSMVPFTLSPVPKVAPFIDNGAQTTLFPKEKEGRKRIKPWTHSAGTGRSNRPRHPEPPIKRRPSSSLPRPDPVLPVVPLPTPETTLEQAAIWVIKSLFNISRDDHDETVCNEASTELIDAIREALERFRATLSRSSSIAAADDGERSKVAQDVNDQLQATWNVVKNAWFDKTISHLALSDSAKNLLSQAVDESILEHAALDDSPSKEPLLIKMKPVKNGGGTFNSRKKSPKMPFEAADSVAPNGNSS